ncbi:6485_t:CDS:2 [Ambispora gerdemannii]|uniref:6485_t:CDS:1 n=1 Tax=Ambispora gerdemannii TaxID=144530 RepID=A0A9N8V7H5_9GLOM|nr:6485_t:CDS:2 [Ambispora gerdemannii]
MSEADNTSTDPITDTEKSSVVTIPPESKSPLIVQEESNDKFKESIDSINDQTSIRQSGSSHRPLIRYTKEQLLALRDSPLVKKPDRLPSMTTWYGKQSNYNLGDGSNKTKDDANTLGIPKSPTLAVQKSPGSSAPTSPKPSGGLKITEDKSAAVPSRPTRTDGIRQRQGEENGSLLRPTGKDFEPRAPRGPTGGRGFVGREVLRQKSMADKSSSRDINEPRDTRDMRDTNGAHHSRMTGSLRTQDLSRGNRRENSGVGGKENLVKSGRARSVSRADSSISWRAENKYIVGSDEDSVNNNVSIEIKENGNKEKQLIGFEAEQPLKLQNVDQLFGPGGIDSLDSGSSDAFDKFLSQHKLAMAEEILPKGIGGDAAIDIPAIGGGRKNEYGVREQPTSRFAKFFNHSEDENINAERNVNEKSKGMSLVSQNHSSTNELLHSAPISLDTLFQSQINVPVASPRAIPNDGKRMLSEAEVLQSLGAKTAVPKNDYDERNPEDIMGFNKILAALAKGNSSEAQRQYTSSNAPIGVGSSIQPPSNEPLSHATGIPFNDPSIIIAQKHHTHTKSMQQQSKYEPIHRQLSVGNMPDINASDSAKKLNMLFGNNVPTSVYRQLSTKSDGGSRESSASSSPALKFNATKPIISNYPHSPNIPQSANLQDHHLPLYKSPPRPRSPILSQQQGLDPSHYHNVMSSYSNNLNVHQHTLAHPEFPPPLPLGRNIPVEQLFAAIPSRNPPPQIHPQYQQAPPQMPFGYQHQADRYQQQIPFSGHQIPQQFSVHPHHAMLPPSTETALFANMHGYAQFIPNLVNNAIAPNTGLPPNNNLQPRGMMTLEEIERRGGLGGR